MRYEAMGGALGALLLLSGCATVNPYNDDTMCPSMNDFGQCVSMTEAYEHTLDPEAKKATEHEGKGKGAPVTSAEDQASAAGPVGGETGQEVTYRGELYKEMASLLREPKTPVIKPPTVRRVLVTSYEDNQELYMPRYFYIVIEKPTWTLREVPGPERDKAVELFSEHEK